MSRSKVAARWRRRLGLPAALVGMVVSVGAVSAFATASAAVPGTIPDGYFVVADVGQVNDVPGQVDLTQMGRKTLADGGYSVFMSWDSTDSWTGSGQTGDACALFDGNGNGRIDAVVCGQVTNPTASPALVTQAAAPYVFRCDDSKTDRCSQPSAPFTYSSAELRAGPLSAATPTGSAGPVDKSLTGQLISATDPFATMGGSNAPNDSALQIDISGALLTKLKAYSGGKYKTVSGNLALTNLCSYPSAGNDGNNHPFDCIAAPGSGFLEIVKRSGSTPLSGWKFDVGPAAARSTNQATTYTVNSTNLSTSGSYTGYTGTSAAIPLVMGSGRTVKEIEIPTGWSLTGATCVVVGGGADGTDVTTGGTLADDTLSSVEIKSGLVTRCTFTNARNTGSVVVKKVTAQLGDVIAAGQPLSGATFTLTAAGSSTPQTMPQTTSTGLTCLDGLPVGDAYTLAETGAPTDYNRDTATYTVTVATVGSCTTRLDATTVTPDKTVSNTRKTGSIAIQKVKGDGTPLAGAAFTVTLVSGQGVGGAQTVPSVTGSTGLFCIAGLPTGGVYTIRESTTPAGYNTAADLTSPAVVEDDCSDAATRTAPKVAVTNNPAAGTINVLKWDDQPTTPRTPLGGAVFTLYRDANNDGTWQTSETTTQGTPQTTSSAGGASFGSVPLGKYCVVETTTPPGYATAAPQCLEVQLGTAANSGQTYNLTFVDPRQHKVIVLVCHEGTNTLAPSSVNLGSGANATKTSLSAGQLPQGVTEAQLCGLGGASYGGLGHATVSPSVTPN